MEQSDAGSQNQPASAHLASEHPLHDQSRLEAWMIMNVAEALGLEPAEVDPRQPLQELGLSSRDAVALAVDLEDALGVTLSPTLVWECPTIEALSHRLLEDDPSDAEPVDLTPYLSSEPLSETPTTVPAGLPVAASANPLLEPIAVVGVGCRLPGGITGPQDYWSLLQDGAEGIGVVPQGRWEQFVGERLDLLGETTRQGGFLEDVAEFDADFFGITPREAELMDPQQRMLLEVTWEALEHGGIPAEKLAGSATGVYVGISGNEYAYLTATDLARVEAWTATGSALSIAANRLSYLMDLHGPSVALDTACSSSLVATHQACVALRTGDVDAAIVAGTNLTLAPVLTVNFDRAGALAPDGRCKPFSADADGIVRSEGVGVVILKRLSTALADGDRVLAVIRGSGVNSDGRSNGLMAPNPKAQETLLRKVYAQAEIDPTTVDYVEAHGTGTLLGDPIEARALGAVLGKDRDDDKPLLVGSVKGNLGHLEAAAGITGLIKVVLSLAAGRVPRSLHAEEPNPHIAWDENHLRVATQEQDWPRRSGTARAGVSAFGFGGTNAHVVLDEYVPAEVVEADFAPEDVVVVEVSGRSASRRAEAAHALAEWLGDKGSHVPLHEVAATLAFRRSRGKHRSVIVARDRAALIDGLERVATGEVAPGALAEIPRGGNGAGVAVVPASRGRSRASRLGPVWVFSGYGAQWAGMGTRLAADEPAFALVMQELEPLVRKETGWELADLLEGVEGGLDVAQTQVGLFAVQVGLAAVWRSYGVEPSAVIGHSMGEVAAAVVAGGLSLADGLHVMSVRSRLLASIDAEQAGAMALVELSADELFKVLDAEPTKFAGTGVAVYAGPEQTTISGPRQQVEELVAYVEELGRTAWVLPVAGAGHSAAVEPVLADMAEQLADITPWKPEVRVYSTVLEDPREVPAFDADYWVKNARQSVRFTHAVAASVADGFDTWLEVSAHPVAAQAIRSTATAEGMAAPVVAYSLRRDSDDLLSLRTNLGLLRANDHVVDVARLWTPCELVDLPAIRWQHVHHWIGGVREIVMTSTASTSALSDRVGEGYGTTDDVELARGVMVDEILELAPDEGRTRILERLVERVATIVGATGTDIETDRPLIDMGFDSLMAVRADNAVRHDFGVPIPPRLVLQGASLDEVAAHVAVELGLGGGSGTSLPERIAIPKQRTVGPRDPGERLLALAWEEALGLEGMSVLQPIPTADETEKSIVRMRLEERFGEALEALDLEALLNAPTIEDQGNVLRPLLHTDPGGMVRVLREGDSSLPTLFLMHPAGEPTTVYEPMIQLLGADYPILGLERLEDGEVEQRAEFYAATIQERQPEGPYRIFGWSLGGILAYETARQLTAAGADVELVGLLDTILPLHVEGTSDDEVLVDRFLRFADHVELTYGVHVDIPLEDLQRATERQQIEIMRELLLGTGVPINPAAVRHQTTSYLDGRASERYQPKPYGGRVLLYRANEINAGLVGADPRYYREDESLGWDEFASALEIVRVPGDHVSVIDPPHIEAVATHLREALKKTRALR